MIPEPVIAFDIKQPTDWDTVHICVYVVPVSLFHVKIYYFSFGLLHLK